MGTFPSVGFAQVCTGMELEQSINLDSKTSGGIIRISQRTEVLERWFPTCHKRAVITTAMKEMCAIQNSDRVGTHREAGIKMFERDEGDVRKLLTVITSELMTDPFLLDKDDDGILPLVDIATEKIILPDAASRLHGTETETAYQGSEILGFPAKPEDQNSCHTSQEEKSETG